MNLLGIDVGTTGCKVAIFSSDGKQIALAYREYNICLTKSGYAELESALVWKKIQESMQEVMSSSKGLPISALSVSSLAESFVPVTKERKILGNSTLNFDTRGDEFLPLLRKTITDDQIYQKNGNCLGNQYSLTKLMWIKKYQPELYTDTYKFLLWGAFVSFMLGSEPMVDFSLANRTLLFDIHRQDWSDDLLRITGLDREKLPVVVPTGTVIGHVSHEVSQTLNLPEGISIISGAHDQCANAVGCGVIDSGHAVYGMGTYHCITPVFSSPRENNLMIDRGLNTEHHAVPGKYVCFIYNQGGSLVKWYRDTFAVNEQADYSKRGETVYPALLSEISQKPSDILVLPHFTQTGSPRFITDSAGVIVGLHLNTTRGEILKGIIEGISFYLREVLDTLPDTGITIHDFRVVGGGSKSDIWIQTCADIFGLPFYRPVITEAGALGAAIIAGVGAEIFSNFENATDAMVKIEKEFLPNKYIHNLYEERYQNYHLLWPLMADYLHNISKKID
jgi:xylulokinase